MKVQRWRNLWYNSLMEKLISILVLFNAVAENFQVNSYVNRKSSVKQGEICGIEIQSQFDGENNFNFGVT